MAGVVATGPLLYERGNNVKCYRSCLWCEEKKKYQHGCEPTPCESAINTTLTLYSNGKIRENKLVVGFDNPAPLHCDWPVPPMFRSVARFVHTKLCVR